MIKPCIAILTYRRLDGLKTLVSQIRTFTKVPYELVVCEGGGEDGTVDWCRENGIRVITGPNKGIYLNRNFGIYWFLNHTDCDVLISMEDDCRLWEMGWEHDWLLAAKMWGHVNYPLPSTEKMSPGDNCVDRPIWEKDFGGMCTASTRDAVQSVGYVDSRFQRYGGEHAEWSYRFARILRDKWKKPHPLFPCMTLHVGVLYERSSFKCDDFVNGMAMFRHLVENDPTVWRSPWTNDKERQEFMDCIDEALSQECEIPWFAGERCPTCWGRGVYLGKRDDVVVRQCCGNLLAWGWESEEQYHDWYCQESRYHVDEMVRRNQPTYWEREGEWFSAAEARVKFIRLFRPDAKSLLDLGCGTGAFVDTAARNQFYALGMDPNEGIVKDARKKHRNLKVGDCQSLSILDGKWDVVTLFDVFEHLTRPDQALENIKAVINPGGLLLVEMPEAGSKQSIKDGLDWKHIKPHQHVCLYCETSARMMFLKHGFEIEAVHRPLQCSLGKISFYLRVP